MSLEETLNNQGELFFDSIKNNDAAFEDFFKKYFMPLCAYCQVKFGFDLDQAKEIVHSGFISLWENRQTLSAGQSPKAYLFKIVTNNSLNVLKHEKVKQRYAAYVERSAMNDHLFRKVDQMDVKQMRTDIQNAINKLPEQMRLIFELSRFEGLKYAEIAAKLNLSVKTVETQIGRALAKLRDSLASYRLPIIILLILGLM